MKNSIKFGIAFALGAAVGGTGVWLGVKDLYRHRTEDEIKSVKEAFRAAFKNDDSMKEEDHNKSDSFKTEDKVSYSKMTKQYQTSATTKPQSVPYIIAPEEYGEEEGYEKVELIYYADKVLADENDEIVEDHDDILGPDALKHFGEYEEDSVCVRDDARKRDIQVLLDSANYTDIVKLKPGRGKLT
jgi:hypothetical protein